MEEPIEPNKEDCCNSGCNPCIFEVFEKQLKLYKKFQSGCESPLQYKVNGISQVEYRSFVVSDICRIASTIKIIKFRLRGRIANLKVWWKPGHHFLVKYNSEGSKASRAYTPIRCNNDCDCDFYIILKKYQNGLVSNYLFNLNVGDKTLWRGPYGLYEIVPNQYKRIVMIAQGTGIAPFVSIIDSILKNEDDTRKLILYFCCHDVESILLRNELYEYKSFWNFTYAIFLSKYCNESTKYEEPVVKRKLLFKDIEDLKPCASDQFLLCGSEQFMHMYENDLSNVNILNENIFLF